MRVIRGACALSLLLGGCTAAQMSGTDAATQPHDDAAADLPAPIDVNQPIDIKTSDGVDATAGPDVNTPATDGSSTTPDHHPDAASPGGVAVFVAVGYDSKAASAPRVATSCDGTVWKNQTINLPGGSWTDPEPNGLRGLGFGGGRFVAVGGGTGVSNINTRRLYVSTDAVNWVHEDQSYECAGGSCNTSNVCTSCQFMGDAAWLDDGTANGVWVMGGGNADHRYSIDAGVSWKRLTTKGTVGQYRRMASAGGVGAATADSGVSIIHLAPGQTPPVTWVDQAMPKVTEPSLAVSNGTAVAVWWDTDCHVFTAGAWQNCTLPHAPTAITSVVFDGAFRIVGRDPPYVSTDGVTYTQTATTGGSDFRQVRFGGGIYVAPDAKRWSKDGVLWESMKSAPTFTITDVEVGYLAACP
jgi:hypothetical protein